MSDFGRFGALAAAATLALGVAFSGAGANASVVISAAVGGAPTGVNYANFDNLPLGNVGGTSGGITVSFDLDGQAVQGASLDRYAAPFLSNNNGVPFGDSENTADTTVYLTTGVGSAFLLMPGEEHYVGLLWGSVDPYNTLKLFNGSTLVGTITGDDVTSTANGDQSASGTYYVNINSTLAFDQVVASSSAYAFEFDNVAYNPTAVPEPGTLALFGAGLVGLVLAGRRRRRA